MRTDVNANRQTIQHGRFTSAAAEAYHRIQQGFAWWEAHRQWPANEPATISEKADDPNHSLSKFTA